MNKRPGASRGWFVLAVWLGISIFYCATSWDYIRTNWNDRKFADYMQYVAQLIGEEQRPPKEARTLLEVKALELGLPVRPENITVLGGGQSISIAVAYEVDIQVPIFSRGIYRKSYQHKVTYRGYRF
jgi:hypothetical protein